MSRLAPIESENRQIHSYPDGSFIIFDNSNSLRIDMFVKRQRYLYSIIHQTPKKLALNALQLLKK